jgi:peptidoglycan/xylan/chitin deacetylase (PgdA/CDA1 family)
VAVTFDDGYADNATVALPVLKRHGISATFFIAPGFLNGGRMWNDSIIESIRLAPSGMIDLDDFGLGVVSLGRVEARGDVAQAIIKSVKHLPPDDRQRKVKKLSDRIGVKLPENLMMTTDQVRKMADAGMEVGAHTMTHPILRLVSDEVARKEIDQSRSALEAILDMPVKSFAYPNGRPGEDYSARDRNLVASMNFNWAVSTRWGAATTRSDLYQLPRFTPWDRTPARWLARLLQTFSITN